MNLLTAQVDPGVNAMKPIARPLGLGSAEHSFPQGLFCVRKELMDFRTL